MLMLLTLPKGFNTMDSSNLLPICTKIVYAMQEFTSMGFDDLMLFNERKNPRITAFCSDTLESFTVRPLVACPKRGWGMHGWQIERRFAGGPPTFWDLPDCLDLKDAINFINKEIPEIA